MMRYTRRFVATLLVVTNCMMLVGVSTASAQDARGEAERHVVDAVRALRQGNLILAGASLTEAVEDDPTFGPAWGSLGLVALAAGYPDFAAVCAKRARSLSPGRPFHPEIANLLNRTDRSVPLPDPRLRDRYRPIPVPEARGTRTCLTCRGTGILDVSWSCNAYLGDCSNARQTCPSCKGSGTRPN